MQYSFQIKNTDDSNSARIGILKNAKDDVK